MNEDDVSRSQINELIRDEIQEVINDYMDERDSTDAIGFSSEEDDQLKVNISNTEVDRLIKKYKKIKKKEKSNFAQIQRLGLVDKNGRPLNG